MRLRGHRGDLGTVVLLELEQMIGVGGDAGPLHHGQHADEWKLHVVQERGGTAAVQVRVERVGELEAGPCPHDVRTGRVRLVRSVDGQLSGVGSLRTQVAPEITQDEIGQVEGALTGQRQVGRERGVAGHPLQ